MNVAGAIASLHQPGHNRRCRTGTGWLSGSRRWCWRSNWWQTLIGNHQAMQLITKLAAILVQHASCRVSLSIREPMLACQVHTKAKIKAVEAHFVALANPIRTHVGQVPQGAMNGLAPAIAEASDWNLRFLGWLGWRGCGWRGCV